MKIAFLSSNSVNKNVLLKLIPKTIEVIACFIVESNVDHNKHYYIYTNNIGLGLLLK